MHHLEAAIYVSVIGCWIEVKSYGVVIYDFSKVHVIYVDSSCMHNFLSLE